jgi:hypothetical protein
LACAAESVSGPSMATVEPPTLSSKHCHARTVVPGAGSWHLISRGFLSSQLNAMPQCAASAVSHLTTVAVQCKSEPSLVLVDVPTTFEPEELVTLKVSSHVKFLATI